MVELEDVKFSIIGDPSQAEAAISKTTSSLQSLGSSVSSLGKGLTVGLTAPLMAIGALALKSSSDVGGAFSEIRKKTNETGAALAGLKTSFTNVWGNVTSDAKETADALSLIHQQTKLTGTGLEDLTTKFSQLAKITETPLVDVVKTATAAMNAWQIPATSMSDALDGLYAVVGRTGISITDLASDLTTLKPTLSALGLSFGASASMIGDFEVAGLDASTMQRVFNSLLNTAKKNGTDVQTTSGI